MSKVSIEFDTVTDDLMVSVDGTKLTNVYGVNIYKYDYDDTTSISINQVEKPENEQDLKKCVTLYASESLQAIEAEKQDTIVGKIGDLVKVDEGHKPVHDAIAALLSRRR